MTIVYLYSQAWQFSHQLWFKQIGHQLQSQLSQMIQQVRHCSHTSIINHCTTHRLHRCTIHVIHLCCLHQISLYIHHTRFDHQCRIHQILRTAHLTRFIHQSPATDSYKVCFKVGNISVCNGCRKRFTEQDQVVIQHAEDRYHTNPQTGLPAIKYGNAYYHPLKVCIQSKWGAAFNQGSLVIPDAVKDKLTLSQKNHLYQEFSVQL